MTNGIRTRHATGGIANWRYGICRITVSLPEATFTEMKIAAMKNGRSISAEINSRLTCDLANVSTANLTD